MGKRKLQEALTLGSSVKRLEDSEDLREETTRSGKAGWWTARVGKARPTSPPLHGSSSARSSSARHPMNGSSAGMAGAAPLRRQRGSSSGLLKWR
jgi:hypothetical protein